MHNVEFKAELRDIDLARSICHQLSATRVGELIQTDTYYRVPTGRFKKRETNGEPVEYVFYDRADAIHPRLSHFTIYSEGEALARFGVQPLPVRAVVRKRRELFLLGTVRIHLDEVEGLGTFLEFEALVTPDLSVVKCHEAVARLRKAFGIVLGEPISAGYADLLEAVGSS